MVRLRADSITISYETTGAVVHDLTTHIPDGAVTSIIGPNGCGKSTLLRALARLLTPRKGGVLLDGESIHRKSTKEVARQLGLLPQKPSAPDSITVEDLARRGRYPHQSFFQPSSERDRIAVEQSLELADMTELRGKPVDELSGGQRQRAWIAMALAQETPILLLDEPTTYLDIAHQQEVLALILSLNRAEGRTIALVLHDVNSAARVSDHVVAMRDGRIVAEGPPRHILNTACLEQVFGVPFDVTPHPDGHEPISLPRRSEPRPEGRPSGVGGDALRSERLYLGYGHRMVVENINISIPRGRITAIVGPNACGKSTLLRAFARLLRPMGGTAFLGETPVESGSHRAFAKRLSILAQEAEAPTGYLVDDLVALGRFPYQSWRRQWSSDDEAAVDCAMLDTGISDLRWREVASLSGGQRQRVWLAMALAQQAPVLLLDEPTTFLDVAHQVEVLELIREMNLRDGRTVVMVLHDLGQACRYSDYLVAMKNGIVAEVGRPEETVTPAFVRDIFDLDCSIAIDPLNGRPLIFPPALDIKGTVGLLGKEMLVAAPSERASTLTGTTGE